MCMGIGPVTGSWATHQGYTPEENWYILPLHPPTVNPQSTNLSYMVGHYMSLPVLAAVCSLDFVETATDSVSLTPVKSKKQKQKEKHKTTTTKTPLFHCSLLQPLALIIFLVPFSSCSLSLCGTWLWYRPPSQGWACSSRLFSVLWPAASLRINHCRLHKENSPRTGSWELL